ncbi:MAG: chorismate mutase [Aestuariivirga sp.]|uniref:chorismate mutase n=1 Tax=Aestuariivirga sp. TaxID=2650926 RepID=UPI0025C06CDC|nr:chorismate mutase [Aestuariivirga sp.]MCA3561373.1 chorismate mutase [Aestuariivirga sp.]
MIADSPESSLDAIRREIDSIDDRILRLLVRRSAATAKVKATKAQDGSIASSPFRPAREAAMMRRLIEEAGSALSPQLLVRLWRVILSASIQSQAPVTLHMDGAQGRDLAMRLLAAHHFCDMKVELHTSPSRALGAVGAAPGDLALIAPGSDWAAGFAEGAAGSAQVILTLPVLARSSQPRLLVFGHAAPQPSGDDETLLLVPGEKVTVVGALWQVYSGTATLASLNGFLDHPPSLHPGTRIAGRYPRPLKVSQ